MSRDALVVGVNAYQKLPRLNAPAADAEAIAQMLENHGECRVYRLPEVIQAGKPAISSQAGVTTQQLETALIRLFKPAGKNVPQTAIFYYSGHGLQRHAGVREGYLATSDVDPQAGHYGLSLFWLRRLLQESPVRQRIIWLDCCHSGELLNYLEADPGAREGTDRLFMAASREYEPAYEALGDRHSVFTKALLLGLNPYKSGSGVVNSHHLTDIVSGQLKGEIQQPLFESSGSDIVLTRTSGRAIAADETTTLSRLKQLSYSFCPFRGLSPFEEAHADYFFGREELSRELTQRVKTSPFCAVVGASSSGKTSLLKAGLIPRLRQLGAASAGVGWDVRVVTPGLQPLQQLAEAFIDPAATGLQRADQLRQAESFLQAGGAGLAQLVRATLNRSQASEHPAQQLVLIIDQLEQALSPQVPSSETSRLLHCLSEVVQDSSLPLHLVVSLRADQLEALQAYPHFQALVHQARLNLPPMAYEAIKATVVKPLEKVGLRYDANLIYTLMLDVVGAPGELPLLQLALQELWRRRENDPNGQQAPRLSLEAYTELGGLRNLLNHRATQVFESLSEAEQQVARRIFLGLCELGEGTEDSRRRVSLTELITPDLPSAVVAQTLEKLIQAHLVVVNGEASKPAALPTGGLGLPEAAWRTPSSLKQDGSPAITWLLQRTQLPVNLPSAGPTLDVVHESLIRTWPLLRQWLEQSRQVLWCQRRLEAAAAEWQAQGCPMHPEYLLTGQRLRAAIEFQQTQSHWLSWSVQQYLRVSQQRDRQQQWRLRAMQLLVPTSILLGMLSAYGQTQLSQAQRDRSPDQPQPTVVATRPSSAKATAPTPRAQAPYLRPSRHRAAVGQPQQLVAAIPEGHRLAPTTLLRSAAARLTDRPIVSSADAPLLLPVTAERQPAMAGVSQPVLVIWCVQAGAAPLCSTAVPQ